ncbi:MocR-like pyridoxine biosynthesis transcription factor PdxR [Prauserella cavernicola]|uniref:PLP-dependent aminotransferase family protein n=1 Tax=Prauserella cavernicola TaxID=2800127 RepID=A0A934R0G0_9PSEU|nr:PLP-dependent aminotransferase family protein [Prauserella cavernicola]MBK1789422.1 PLP-dependent aminotransferase family protein [Prauserella cavernicola]
MDVHVTLDGHRDLSGQIYRQLRAAILDGRLREGDRVPPSRELARRLAVARNTVGVAYERLTAEGYLRSRVGAGTFVEAGDALADRATGSAHSALRARPGWPAHRRWPPPAPPATEFDFRVGLPDTRLFPFEQWRPLVARELRPSANPTGYGDPAGHAGLRHALARHIGLSRAVRADADDIVITNGVQQALDLVARVVLEPGDRVAVEQPGYPPARLLFTSLGLDVAGVPVDSEGLRVDAIPEGTRLVLVTPSHQFPLGMPMSLHRRLTLLDWARRHRAVVVEDDYDSEFRFGGRPIDSLRSLDESGHVVYVNSFSKVMLPSLRTGFLVAPAPLREALRTAKYVTDWSTTEITQAALARFVDDGRFARHVRRMRAEYEARHTLITTTLRRDFADRLEVVPSSAGLHITAHVTAHATGDVGATVTRARAAGVAVQSLAEVADDPAARPGLVLGYGAIETSRIAEGLRRLAACA